MLDADSNSTSIGINLQTDPDLSFSNVACTEDKNATVKYLSLLSLELLDIQLILSCTNLKDKTSIKAKKCTSMEGMTESLYKPMSEAMKESMHESMVL